MRRQRLEIPMHSQHERDLPGEGEDARVEGREMGSWYIRVYA